MDKQNFDEIQKAEEKKKALRDKKKSSKMKVSGASVKKLGKIIKDKK